MIIVVPARLYSTRVSEKMLQSIEGVSLLGWTLKAALAARTIKRIFVSTGDARIKRKAELFNARVIKRPKDLSKDDTTLLEILRHAVGAIWKLNKLYARGVLLLQPTNPMITHQDINAAVSFYDSIGHKPVRSVTAFNKTPNEIFIRGAKGKLTPSSYNSEFSPNKKYYIADNTIRIFPFEQVMERDWKREEHGFIIPPERSLHINNWSDLDLASKALTKKAKNGISNNNRK